MISANRRVIDTAEKNRLFIEVYVFHEMTYIYAIFLKMDEIGQTSGEDRE